MPTQHPFVVLDSLRYTHADGTPVFDGLSGAFPAGVTGIIGPNGLGKTVLLRLIAGELTPQAGTLSRPERLAVLPQRLTLDSQRTVAQLLGAAPAIEALRELTQDEPSAARAGELMEIIGEDWDAEDAARARLADAGLDALAAAPDGLTRTVGTLSGGEAMAVALAGLRATDPELTLLDEPTNNLDAAARERFLLSLETWPGSVLVVSHDRALLRRVGQLAQLRPVRVRGGRAEGVRLEFFGGNWDELQERRALEREAGERAVRDARAELSGQRRAAQQAATAQARRDKAGAKAAASMPKILANTRKNAAEATAGKSRAAHAAKVDAANSALDAARDATREVASIDINVPGAAVGAGTVVLESAVPALPGERRVLDDGVWVAPGERLLVRGPERIALRGPNGAGKSTLLEAVLPGARVPAGALRQRTGTLGPAGAAVGEFPVPDAGGPGAGPGGGDAVAGFDDDESVVGNLGRLLPGATQAHLLDVLGRLRLSGPRVQGPYGRLSGGERFRADLARVLAAEPTPRLLVLDEPTNDLDLDSVQSLGEALAGFGGALILVSHDEDFLQQVGVERTWEIAEAEPKEPLPGTGDAVPASPAEAQTPGEA